MKDYQFVYGPVPSRRLGRSLGVDLVPFKICSYDCIYCQLGRTTNKTIVLDEYIPVDEVLAELRDKLRDEPRPDFIGLAGSGEPTLHSRIGDVIAGIKSFTEVPVAVLTNGSLLWMPEVRDGLAKADLVMPSLDVGSPETFARVNRPHVDISFDRMVDGLLTFAHEFKGKIWLEVFILAGITNQQDEVKRIAAIADKMRPKRVQLNTVARPTAEVFALTTAAKELESFRCLFSSPGEVIAENYRSGQIQLSAGDNTEARIIELLKRRPCTVEGIATGLGLRPNDVLKHLDALIVRKDVRSIRDGDAVFYDAKHNIDHNT